MTWLIALFALATAGIHLYVGANGITNGLGPGAWLLILNGIGFIVLMVLYLMRRGTNRSSLRWIFIAYTALTIVLYFLINPDAMSYTLGLVTKAIEAILIILLLLDRKSDEASVKAAASSAAVAGSRAAGAVNAGAGSAAAAAGAAGAAVAGAAAKAAGGAGAVTGKSLDAVENTAEDITASMSTDELEGLASRAGAAVADLGEAAADAAVGAGAAVADAAGAVTAAAAAAGAASWEKVKDLFDGEELGIDEMRSRLKAYLPTLGDTSNFFKQIEYVEGIGEAYGKKLRAVGVDTPFELLSRGAFRRGRATVATESGIEESRILTWTNNVDLYRIKGVGQEYADLLEQSGVDTVVELAQRNPTNLHKRMLEINEEKKLVRRPPHLSEVQSWIEQAKGLPRIMHY